MRSNLSIVVRGSRMETHPKGADIIGRSTIHALVDVNAKSSI